MPNRSLSSTPGKPGSPFFAFLFLSAMAAAFLLGALVLGTEPRMTFERSADGTFRVTGSNYFSGFQFYTKTIEGVKSVVMDDAVRDDHRDSNWENQKRRRDKHLDLFGADGARLGWDGEDDQQRIEEFMRGKELSLSLVDKPPVWRMGIAWFLAGFGALTFLGAIQSFFPKKKASAA